MSYLGVIIHHSVCPSINGKGYDFYIDRKCNVIPANSPSHSEYIHVCIEGDFNHLLESAKNETKEQMFVLNKLLIQLSYRFKFVPEDILPHALECPGEHFRWSELVISVEDRYH